MKIPYDERETIINMDTQSDKASIYTSDFRMMTKLDKCVKESDDWKLVHTEMCGEDLVSKTYECPSNFVSFRKKKVIGKPQTEEQKAAFAERMKERRLAESNP